MTAAIMHHSLSHAVARGIITDQAACCGLSPDDLSRLAQFAPQAEVLVRLRSAHGDGRVVLSAVRARAFADDEQTVGVHRSRDIRDIMAVAL